MDEGQCSIRKEELFEQLRSRFVKVLRRYRIEDDTIDNYLSFTYSREGD